MNVLRIIDELEQLVENSKGGFMGKRVINEEEFFTKIQQLRSALPKSMKEAEDLMRKAEAVVKSAQTEADRLIDTAEREAERVVTEARTRTDRAIAESKSLAERTVAESKTHADRLLLDAQTRSEKMTGDARSFAERTTTDSSAKAEKMVADAKGLAERTISDAGERADKAISDAAAKAAAMVEDAQTRAAHIETEARRQADEMVAEHSVTLRAHEEADAHIGAATNDAEALRDHADKYAIDVLDKVGGVLEKLQLSVTQGKSALHPAQNPYPDGASTNGNGYAGEYAPGEYVGSFRN